MFDTLPFLFEVARSRFEDGSFDLRESSPTVNFLLLMFFAILPGVKTSSDSSSTLIGLIPSPSYWFDTYTTLLLSRSVFVSSSSSRCSGLEEEIRLGLSISG